MAEKEWQIDGVYANMHNGNTIKIIDRLVRDNGVILWKGERMSDPLDGYASSTTYLTNYDAEHWERINEAQARSDPAVCCACGRPISDEYFAPHNVDDETEEE